MEHTIDNKVVGAPAYQTRSDGHIVCEAFQDPHNGTIHVYVYGNEDRKVVLHDYTK